MKTTLLFIFLLIVTTSVWGQSNWPGYQCVYQDTSGQSFAKVTSQTSTGTKHMIVILCVTHGQSTAIPVSDIDKLSLPGGIPDYINRATFGNWNVPISDVLVHDNNGTTAHAFVLPDDNLQDCSGQNGCLVVPGSSVENVLAQADSIYDFSNYDNDHDGTVDYVAFVVYRYPSAAYAQGTDGLRITTYPTNDYENGTPVEISGANSDAVILRERRGMQRVIDLMTHELGHSLFGWPDVDHCYLTYYDHSSFGDFSTMSSGWGGFQNVASLYNPAFRVVKGWATPTSTSGTQTFTDFDATGKIYSYTLPSNSSALSDQKYYFTDYTKDPNNPFQANWPVPLLSDGIHHAGVLAWRTIGNNLLANCTYGDRKAMPVTLVAAHGKWKWDENNAPDLHDINTGQPDILGGLDSLQEPYSYIWGKYNSQTGKQDWQLYKGHLYQIGSASCFFAPENKTNFAFYTNPSSNEVASSGEARSITSGFAMKNLRWVNGQTKADLTLPAVLPIPYLPMQP